MPESAAATNDAMKWPGYTGEMNPHVWSLEAMPEQPKEKKEGQLSPEQLKQYFEQGVVLVDKYFTDDELNPVKKDIELLVSNLAELLYDNEKITDKFSDMGLFQRLTAINKAYPGANILLHKMGWMPQSIKDLWNCDKLMNAVEQFIGRDIGGHPVWNLRTKTPQDEATTVPWHQDCAYLDRNSYKVHQPTAWIPLLDATPENGCMEFALRGHKLGKIAMHQCCSGDTHYVMLEKEEMAASLDVDLEKDLQIMPVNYGSVLFFNNCIPHRSLNNLSDEIRWSLDLRWQDPKKPWGFHGVSEGMWFRKASDPDWRPGNEDWKKFLGTPRELAYRSQMKAESSKDFDTTIVGPWMKSWELVHMNRHTDKLTGEAKSSWHGRPV